MICLCKELFGLNFDFFRMPVKILSGNVSKLAGRLNKTPYRSRRLKYNQRNKHINFALLCYTIYAFFFFELDHRWGNQWIAVKSVCHQLTYCGLLTSSDDIALSQHWLKYWLFAWRHQAIIWTSAGFLLWRLSGIDSETFKYNKWLGPYHQATSYYLNWCSPC